MQKLGFNKILTTSINQKTFLFQPNTNEPSFVSRSTK